ncbi:PulJ/GspJ family protein [Sphaerochaeta sp.]|uniref:PulJ/GspJ family protein n=1 Tax=Sphaerochaeta sp. TaxID=1972642 RepID=UPI003D149532
MKRSDKGFTLIEMLIALLISAFVVMGVYSLFNSVINSKEAIEKSNRVNTLLMSARRLFKPDLLQLYQNSLSISNAGKNAVLNFTSLNSIKLDRALPVDITYYVDDDGWLIREEEQIDIGYSWKLRLLPEVTDFTVYSHNGYKFTEDHNSTDTIIQVSFKYKDIPVEFVAGCGFTAKGLTEAAESASSSTSTTSSSSTATSDDSPSDMAE